jgi:hypothetical protein
VAVSHSEIELGSLPPPAELADVVGQRRQVPAWLMSGACHVVLMLLLAMLVKVSPRGADVEPNRSGGIVLVQRSQNKTEYLTDADAADSSASQAASAAAVAVSSPLPSRDEVPVDLAGVLPSPQDLIGPGGDLGAALPGAGDFTVGSSPSKQIGSKAKTYVFGVEGEGSKFVYVFDRSGSMEGYSGRPLASAKAELIASLKSLQSVHQFQIIFYNDRPSVMNPFYPQQPRLLFGDDQSKRLAENFVRGVVADGGTRHMEALKLALGMTPDVIFFLTDAEEPQLTPAELAEIERLNKRVGATINTIEFGSGPYNGSNNFLVRLARMNGGRHGYVDVSSLPRVP